MFLQCRGEGRETGNRIEEVATMQYVVPGTTAGPLCPFEAQASNCYIIPSTALYFL